MRHAILRTLNIVFIVAALDAGSVAHAQETVNTRIGKRAGVRQRLPRSRVRVRRSAQGK